MTHKFEVVGVASISWQVELPEGFELRGTTTKDPAVGALIDFLPQSGKVYLWGEDKPPAEVFIELLEDEVIVEEDDRE